MTTDFSKPPFKQIAKDLIKVYYQYITTRNEEPTWIVVSPTVFDTVPRALIKEFFPKIYVKQLEFEDALAPTNGNYFWFEQWENGMAINQGPFGYLDLEPLFNPPTSFKVGEIAIYEEEQWYIRSQRISYGEITYSITNLKTGNYHAGIPPVDLTSPHPTLAHQIAGLLK